MPAANEGRDAQTIALYERWVQGESQQLLADEIGIAQRSLSERFKRIRSMVKTPTFEEYIERETALLDDIRKRAYRLLKYAADNPAPVTNVKGDPIKFWDAERQEERCIWDRSAELAAAEQIMKTHDRMVKMHGLAAPQRLEVTGETDKTKTLAAEAAARLNEEE